MVSTKPYLLRAIYQWAEENGFTAQVLVDALLEGVEVPISHVADGQIVLNVSSTAVQMHTMDNDCLSFSARFNGQNHSIFLPMNCILAIFARENSQGIFFEGMDGDGSDPDVVKTAKPKVVDSVKKPAASTEKKSGSHLKIIK